MFGIGAVSVSKSIDLIMELTASESDENEPIDRLGLEDRFLEILGVSVPCLKIPIKPGRNLAIIVEVASRNHSLKRAGLNAAKDLISAFHDS